MVLHRCRAQLGFILQVLQIGLNERSAGLQHFHQRVLALDGAVHYLVHRVRRCRGGRGARGCCRVRRLLRVRAHLEQQESDNRPVPNTHNSTEIEISFLPSASTSFGNSKSGGAVAVVHKFVVTRRLLAWGVLRSATGGCLCFLNVKWCRPGANVERRVKISLTALFLSELGETWQLGQTAIRKSPVAGFHQGGGFQPWDWKSAKDCSHESVGEIDSMRM